MTPPLPSIIAESPDRSLPPLSALSGFLRDIRKPAHLLVAISGGSDSTGLLVGLSQILPFHPDIRLSAATIDHALRPGAAEEARAVARLCAELGIFHVIRRWEGEKPTTGISAAAREARYSLLSAIAGEIGATAIVTGHTADDQVETVVMRAGRAEGQGDPSFSPGLSGMAPATLLDARHWILRPFLHSCRSDIRAFLSESGYSWIDDPSNLDPHYERVRVRQTLAAGIPSIDFETIMLATRSRVEIAQRAADWLVEYAQIEQQVIAKIDPSGFGEKSAAIRHAISMLAAVLGGRPHSLSRENADRLMVFVDSGMHGRMTTGRVIFDRRRDGLFLLRENRNLPHLSIGAGQTVVWDGRFRIENRGLQPIEVVAGTDHAAAFENAHSGLAKLGARVSPHVPEQGEGLVAIAPHLAPFDRFLPVFDLPLAAAIARLMGRQSYLLPPV
ncbi:tRNA lysidine(34) synthetase TilS [Endobacterium cereale]|uniref:tRNA lysidine(34) synthetase TilS n=1 Tax=Endobacterium cereale TaxID=2663029 RepID=UPI002B460E97|nr:tRNA lysidine(34) synthetase TilS [Endobacterium cereale]MEB2845795.1 tRNA lysidine(34) synthetase TilS [Endobacterium cereale]